MGSVVVDVSKRIADGTHVHSGRRTVGIRFDLVPESVEVASCSSVAVDVVGRVGDPERSSRSVSLKHAGGLNRTDGQVVPDRVVSLYTILNKEVVALDSETNVMLDCQVVNPVDGGHSGKRVVDGVAPNV